MGHAAKSVMKLKNNIAGSYQIRKNINLIIIIAGYSEILLIW